jgi:hypothetical protein
VCTPLKELLELAEIPVRSLGGDDDVPTADFEVVVQRVVGCVE